MTAGAPVFAVGTGRCGTHFLAALFDEEPAVLSCHESNPFNAAFHRYCAWNNLPVDDGGFLAIKRREIQLAAEQRRIFFEASGYLSLSIGQLFETFGSRFILLTRGPVDAVNSLWAKGWYDTPYGKQDDYRPVGYHEVGAPHHFFSRLVPAGAEFRQWNALTRIGKLAWFWSALHQRILAQLAELPEASQMIVKLEELDHCAYRGLAAFAGIVPTLRAERFNEIAAARPGAVPAQRLLRSWSDLELEEFSEQVTGVCRVLGYATGFERQRDAARSLQGDAQPDIRCPVLEHERSAG